MELPGSDMVTAFVGWLPGFPKEDMGLGWGSSPHSLQKAQWSYFKEIGAGAIAHSGEGVCYACGRPGYNGQIPIWSTKHC